MVERRKEMHKQLQIHGLEVDTQYGLENLWFNADLDPQTLWVNLGYWEVWSMNSSIMYMPDWII